MIKSTGVLRKIKFDGKRYTKKFRENLEILMRNAVREWLIRALQGKNEGGKFPVLTGMAKASLIPVGRLVRMVVPVSLDYEKLRASGWTRWHVKRGDYGWDRRAEGKAAGKADLEILSNQYGPFRVNFNVQSLVEHLEKNDLFPRSSVPEAPWGIFAAANNAFNDYVDNNIQQYIPKIEDYILYSDVTGG